MCLFMLGYLIFLVSGLSKEPGIYLYYYACILFNNRRNTDFLLCLVQCIFKDLSVSKYHRDYIGLIRLLPTLGFPSYMVLTKVIYGQDISRRCLTRYFLVKVFVLKTQFIFVLKGILPKPSDIILVVSHELRWGGGREGFIMACTLTSYSSLSKEVRAGTHAGIQTGTWSLELNQRSWRGTLFYWLAPSTLTQTFFLNTPGTPAQDVTTHSGLGLPISIIDQENALQTKAVWWRHYKLTLLIHFLFRVFSIDIDLYLVVCFLR